MRRSRSSRVTAWWGILVLVTVTGVLLACDLPSFGSFASPGATSVSAQITAAQGGTLAHNGATLTIPPHALPADATVTLTDTGAPAHAKDDPLRYVSDAFTVATKDANGKPVGFTSPATLSITPSATIGSTVHDLIVADLDPSTRQAIHLYPSTTGEQGSTSGHEASRAAPLVRHLALTPADAHPALLPARNTVSSPYSTLNSSMWAVAVPSLATPNPTEASILQVPFYHQSGLGWCVPTSLTAMLRYYDLTPTTGDPLNATYGSDLALANWQVAAQSHQSAGSWANYSELANIGVPLISDASGTGAVGYLWDVNLVNTVNGARGAFNDFQIYVILVNTGLLGLVDRKPLMLGNDAAGHSLVIVGVDGDNIYLHDSNGAIAEKKSWSDFQAYATSATTHDIYTEVAYGYPVRPATLRTGSIVVMQGNSTSSGIVSSDSQGFPTQLNWDGAVPHDHGYYLNDASYQGLGIATQDLGYHLLRGVPLHYNYAIANVTNVPLTYRSVAELSGPTFGVGVVSQVHTVTVAPYSLSSLITGTFTPPNSGASAFFDVKLYEVGSASVLQDVKFLRLSVHDSLTPTVTIAHPANGAHVYAGSSVVFSGSGFDQDDGNKLPDWDLSWSANSTVMGSGASITHQFAATGTYTITLKGTNSAGATGSASISITVDPAPPNAVVTIVAPTNGEYITVDTNASSAQVELVASGSPGMQFSWSDSIDGPQGAGADIFATLTVQNQGNCAPVTTHTITLTGIDNLSRTKTAQVTFSLRPTCIQ